jgi:hypothetical protein
MSERNRGWKCELQALMSKVKVKSCPCARHEVMWGSGGMAPPHWTEVSGKIHAPASLPPQKVCPVFGLEGLQSRSGRHGEEKHLRRLAGNRNPSPRRPSP